MYQRADLLRFLRAVDTRLTRPGGIRLIGGAVICLAYVPTYTTRDVDYAWADREVDAVVRELAVSSPELVRAEQSGVYFAPYTYEDRLEVLGVPGLVYLRVEIPDRHDLAVMKIARGLERDLEVVEALHQNQPFDATTLVERYEETWVAGSQRLADIGLREVLETLFGAKAADTGMELLADLRSGRGRSRRRS